MKLLFFLRRHWMIVALMIVALALRVWYLTINPLWPQFSNADDGDYFQRALRFAVAGNYFDDSWLIRPPLHVAIFAAWIKVALLLGEAPTFGVRLIQGFQVALGVLMVPLCYALGARLLGQRAGIIFAAFWAVWFPFVELPATLFSEPIYLFLFTVHLWLLLRFDANGRYRDLAFAGLVLGCAALTRSPALYALVFAAPWLLLRGWRRAVTNSENLAYSQSILIAIRASIRPLLVLALCTFVVVLPWTARNWIVYQRFIPVDTLGPINLWLDLGQPDERNAKIEQLRQLPQADRQAYASAQVRAILREDSIRPLRNVWPTFRHIWKAQFVEDFWVKRSFFTRPLREAAPLGLAGDLLWLFFTVGGVIGVLHPATDRPFKALLGLWLLYSFVTVLVFHVEPRYLLSIWFLFGLYGAWTIGQGWQWLGGMQRYRWRATLVAAVMLVLCVLFVTYRDYPSIISRGVRREQHMARGDRLYAQRGYAAAEQAYRAALEADPQFVDAEVALALALNAQGNSEQGVAVLTPDASRRSILVGGILERATGNNEQARALLSTIERRMGEDGQRWALNNVVVEPRNALVLGDDALDLGYIVGFAESERSGDKPFRWLLGDGKVVLPLPQPLQAGQHVVFELAAPLVLEAPLQLQLDTSTPLVLSPNPQWRAYRLPVPPSLVGHRVLQLSLRAPTRLPMRDDPQSTDPRALSVMVHRVAIEPGLSSTVALPNE